MNIGAENTCVGSFPYTNSAALDKMSYIVNNSWSKSSDAEALMSPMCLICVINPL